MTALNIKYKGKWIGKVAHYELDGPESKHYDHAYYRPHHMGGAARQAEELLL